MFVLTFIYEEKQIIFASKNYRIVQIAQIYWGNGKINKRSLNRIIDAKKILNGITKKKVNLKILILDFLKSLRSNVFLVIIGKQ